ncbi:MAG: hypothetical protein U0412_06780 [Nitrospira sp.]
MRSRFGKNPAGLAVIVAALALIGCAAQPRLPERLDFQSRCRAAEAVRCFGFDSASDTDPHVYPPWGFTQKRAAVVHDVKASGAGSLRFEIPSNSGSDSSGSFWLNFADDFSVQFGERQEFYVQWRQRFSPELLNTRYAGGGGWKQIIIGEGDRPGFTADSCTQLEIVLTNADYLGAPTMYHSCGGKDGQFEGLFAARSMSYEPNEWMTFQVHVKIGTWYRNDGSYHQDSTVQLWMGREGQPSKLVVDLSPEPGTVFGLSIPGSGNGYDLANSDPAAKYGKVWLLPYNTHKDPTESHPVGYTWYDDLIIARKKIPDPY